MSNKLAFQLISRRWLHDGKLPRVISNFMRIKKGDAIPKNDHILIDHEIIKTDGDETCVGDVDKGKPQSTEDCPYDRED